MDVIHSRIINVAEIGVISQVHPFLWLSLSCPRSCLLCKSTGYITKGIFKFQVAACELLHSIVTYMLGKASQMPEGRQGPPPMYQLHKRLFPVLLRLACDVDQVKRFIYKPLACLKCGNWSIVLFRSYPVKSYPDASPSPSTLVGAHTPPM